MLLATANAANTEEVSYENVCQSRMPLILIQITPLLFAASYQMTTRPNAHPLVVVIYPQTVNKKRNLIRRRDEAVPNKRQQMKQIKKMEEHGMAPMQSITLDTLIEEAEKVEEEMEEVEELIEQVVNTPVETRAVEHPEPMTEGGEPSEGGDDMALRMHKGNKHNNNKNKKSHKKKNNKKNNKSKNKKNNKNSSKANKNDRPNRDKQNMRAHTQTDPMHQAEDMEAHAPDSYGGKSRKLTRGA